MNNRIRSYKLEQIRRGYEYFETAQKQKADTGQIHDSYFSSFVGQFESIRPEFQAEIETGDLGFPRVKEEYLLELLDNGSEDFLAILIGNCTSTLTNELIQAFQGNQLRAVHNVVEVYWSYFHRGTPNEYVYQIELHPLNFEWRFLEGKFSNMYDDGVLDLPLDKKVWYSN